jgi:hypothetical protein
MSEDYLNTNMPIKSTQDELMLKAICDLKTECLTIFNDFLKKEFTPVAGMALLAQKEYLTEHEVELLYSIPVATLRTWRSRRRGPNYIKDGKKVLYPNKELKAYFGDRLIKHSISINFD